MRDISGALISDLSGDTIKFAYLIDLKSEHHTVFRLCDWSRNLSLPSVGYYISWGIKMNKIRYGGSKFIDSFSCQLEDTKLQVYNSMKNLGSSRIDLAKYSVTPSYNHKCFDILGLM